MVKSIWRMIAVLGLVAVLAVFINASIVTAADERPKLSSEHIDRIVSNCTSAKSTLSQLHRSDGLLRVNRGQAYEYVGTGLMSSFNSRLTLNKINAGSFVAITQDYDKEVRDFRLEYKAYEVELTNVLRIDCSKYPEQFYYGVINARKKRAMVYQKVVELTDSTQQYYKQFQQFKNDFLGSNKENKS